MTNLKAGSKQPGTMLASILGHDLAQLSPEQQQQIALLESLRFDPNNCPPVDFLLRWNGLNVIPAGNLVVFTGREGQGKSSAMAIVTAVLLSGKDFAGLQRIKPVRRVLWIDTEQAMSSFASRLQTLASVAGMELDNLEERGLFTLHLKNPPALGDLPDTTVRREIISLAVAWYNPDLVVIDGIFDCVGDDERDTPHTVQNFWESMTAQGITVFTAIHTNKNDDNLPYAVGTQLHKKTSDIFTCFRDPEAPRVTVKHTRAKESDFAAPMEFEFTAGGQLVGTSEAGRLLDVVRALFATVERYTWPEIKAAMKAQTGCTADQAAKEINKAVSKGYVNRNGTGNETYFTLAV